MTFKHRDEMSPEQRVAYEIGRASVPPPAFNLRMPPELKLALAALAQENGRSLNAEIVYRLQKSLTTYRQL